MKVWSISIALMLCLLPVWPLEADTVRLKNGKTLQGTIVSEDNTDVSIEVTIAGGSILKTETFKKDDIAEVRYATAEEREQIAAEQEYRELKKYVLDPNRSYTLEYYDRVINGVLRYYLQQHSNSVHVAEIQDKITLWQAERDVVASGKGKFQGRWLPAAEVEQMAQQERDKQLLDRVTEALSSRQYEKAITLATGVTRSSKDTETVEQAQRLRADSCQRWLKSVEDRMHDAEREVQNAEQHILSSQQARDRAQKNLDDYKRNHHEGTLGYGALLAQYESVVQRAETEIIAGERALSQVREDAVARRREYSDLQARIGSLGEVAKFRPPPPQGATNAPPPPPPPPPPPDIVDQVGGFIKKYWWAGLVAVMLLAWGSVRIFTK